MLTKILLCIEPGAPTLDSAIPNSNTPGEVAVSWSPAFGSTQDKYIVTYTGASDIGSDTDEVLSTTTSKTYDLTAGHQYTFSVKAVSGTEESADSNQITKGTCK